MICPEIIITFDLRITPKWSQVEAEAFIQRVCDEAGDEITFDYILKGPIIPETPMTADNRWWTTFKSGCDLASVTKFLIKRTKSLRDITCKNNNTVFYRGIHLLPMICPGATDARFLREIGIPAFGFSPMNNTPILLHDNNEFVNEKVFLKGIEIYEKIIQNICSTEGD